MTTKLAEVEREKKSVKIALNRAEKQVGAQRKQLHQAEAEQAE